MSELQNTSPRRSALLVAGVHRSGTSAITGVSELLGATIPNDLMMGTEHNEKGYFESWSVVAFHDALLWAQGSAWEDLAPLRPMDGEQVSRAGAELSGILEREYGGASLVAIKEPRMCRFLPVTREALRISGRNVHVVIPLRHPMEVVGSLKSRDGLTDAHAILLWLQHILPAERHTRDLPRCTFRYDDLLRDWRPVIARISGETGLEWPKSPESAAAEIDGFLNADLRHFAHGDDEFPDDLGALGRLAAEVWRAMLTLVDAPLQPGALAALDAAGQKLAFATDLFGPFARQARERDNWRRERIESEERRAREAEDRSRERGAEINRLGSELRDREATVKRLRKRTLKSRLGAPMREYRRLIKRLRG
ncbi:hypothetical protein SAMN05216548_102210 [Faunimonas pinastri]|uniref:Sulfotransferase family protein n=1 Tax=Faunimonas pinastri TaxID=1855383 RepID=A0A1H9CP08_9HYPH|nr:hypothetical protein [Faunimonas pinastri]SEQ02962.1 hypothetical protein SAMN05216548_102210 [Faunimonas pinastri]